MKYKEKYKTGMIFRNKTTFPYPFLGEMKPKSMDVYIKNMILNM